MKKYELLEIFEHAKKHSDYYKKLYQNVSAQKLLDIPVVDQYEFWQHQVITSSPEGLVFKSGGSTGSPKFSYFTHEEWETYTQSFGLGLSRSILKKGDRLANLFYGGDLYASFFFIKDSIRFADPALKLVHFPIAGQTAPELILKSLNEFKINVLCGVPSALVLLFQEYEQKKEQYPDLKIERILYGGEGFYEDQMNFVKKVFPTVAFASIGCASVDGGMIGYSSPDCQEREHRVMEEVGLIEIVDEETLLPITEKGVVGKMLLTNLTRKLMPIIRYPSGDRAMWIDDDQKNRKFQLCGRSDEAARLGTISVYYENTRDMVLDLFPNNKGMFFQMITEHLEMKDQLTLCVYTDEQVDMVEMVQKITKAFEESKTTYRDLVNKNLIHPLKVVIQKNSAVQRNERTGKIKRIIDLK